MDDGSVLIPADDIVETLNHFRAFDFILDRISSPLDHDLIRQLHGKLKRGTTDEDKGFAPGEYKKVANIVGDVKTSSPKNVQGDMEMLLRGYESKAEKELENILDFHVRLSCFA